jgi:Raf kinase inhibitor-like YbhB/YbcL family protein
MSKLLLQSKKERRFSMKRSIISIMLIIILLLTLSACSKGESAEKPAEAAAETPTEAPAPEPTVEAAPMPDMAVSSEGIVDGAMGIKYGAKNEEFAGGKIPTLSLPLKVEYIPEGTVSLAVVMIDPDGGNWVHWLVANIPVDGTVVEIPENASLDWPEDIVQGRNDFGFLGYGGPTPPSGVHTYVTTVYALSDMLELESGFKLPAIKQAMEGIILAEAQILGSYAR